MTVTSEPSPWITADPDLLGEKRLEGVQLASGWTLDDCCQVATNYLWRVTGRRFTTYTRTFRPPGCAPGFTVELPDAVASIDTVTVDGVVVPSSAYELVNDRLLARTDGLTWPAVQRLDVPNGTEGTWSVRYTGGSPPPTDGKIAARELAIDIAQHLDHGAGKSRIGARVQTVSRQGVTFNVRATEKGLTGIPLVDLFIDSIEHEHVPFSVTNVDAMGVVV